MTFQKRLWRLSLLILIVLGIFSGRILYWQLIQGIQMQAVALNPLSAAALYAQKEQKNGPPVPNNQGSFENLGALPQPVLQRTIALLKTIKRGAIYDRNGTLLVADQVANDGSVTRVYSDPSTVFITGYTSALRTGLTGLERSYNDTLLGVNRLDAQFDMAVHEPVKGSDLILTIDDNLQQATAQMLGDRPGAAVIIDAHTGAVLAMASYPGFDPNHVLDTGYAASLQPTCSTPAPCTAPFLDRAMQSLYTPGSTFKTVTAIAALDTGQVTPDTVFNFGTPQIVDGHKVYYYHVGGGAIPDPNHSADQLTMTLSYAYSANAAFAKIGDQMNPGTFIDYAQRLGFSQPSGQTWPFEIEYTPSQLANNTDDIRNNALLRASTAIGQGELGTTPMNMAMVVLSVVNGGNLPIPYFVQAVRAPDGSLDTNLPNRRTLYNLYSRKAADEVRNMMIVEVKQGGGTNANIPGITVGGKTGTAQLGGEESPHAWFIGFADNGQQEVVMAIAIENAGGGYLQAAPFMAQLAPMALDILKQRGP